MANSGSVLPALIGPGIDSSPGIPSAAQRLPGVSASSPGWSARHAACWVADI